MANREAKDTPEADDSRGAPKDSWLSKIKRHWGWAALGGTILAALIFGYWWMFMRGRVTTDDAYVKADTASISSRIQGSVTKVHVENDTAVEAGDVLVEMDPSDYKVAVDAATAMVDRIEAEMRAAEMELSILDRSTAAQVRQAQAKLDQLKQDQVAKTEDLREAEKKRGAAQADLDNAQREFARFDTLYREGYTSQEKRDDALTNAKKAKSALEALNAQIRSLRASRGGAQQQVDQAMAKQTWPRLICSVTR